MADAPSGPSVLSHYAGAGLAGEQQREEERHKGRHHHQLNGLISPDLRHLKAVSSLKNKLLEQKTRKDSGLVQPQGRTDTRAPNGLERLQGEEEKLSACLASCSLRGDGEALGNHVSQGENDDTIRYVRYESELQMADIMRLITRDLSEPYSIYTYRYFIHNWPQLCFLVVETSLQLFFLMLKDRALSSDVTSLTRFVCNRHAFLHEMPCHGRRRVRRCHRLQVGYAQKDVPTRLYSHVSCGFQIQKKGHWYTFG
ncbi:N-alpha-acetyltransferase 30 isoform X1 [Xenopus laevis]|uniref:N-alpha-acetyltransferase 30 isoform X1 n=1 Tax=Xenopus laevis TaxID=8355 RepID=A0A8J0TLJ7_XENLA|nr:N-alpha-acetyltransferase 30 isoform X1 [Xenopus laevis]